MLTHPIRLEELRARQAARRAVADRRASRRSRDDATREVLVDVGILERDETRFTMHHVRELALTLDVLADFSRLRSRDEKIDFLLRHVQDEGQ